MTTLAVCDAPCCPDPALVHIAAIGPCGQFDGFLCPIHAEMFRRAFPVQRIHEALLVAITEEDLRHG